MATPFGLRRVIGFPPANVVEIITAKIVAERATTAGFLDLRVFVSAPFSRGF
jgi:hypothetical protein